jgi:hypothetical protein
MYPNHPFLPKLFFSFGLKPPDCMKLTFSKMSNIDIKFYLVLPVLWHKVLYHEPNHFSIRLLRASSLLPSDFWLTAGSITNGPIPGGSESFMALSMVKA